MLFLAIEHHLDRRLRLFRQPRADHRLRILRAELAAEAAAHVLRDDAHIGSGNLKTLGEPVSRGVDALR